MSDAYGVYQPLSRWGWQHRMVNHSGWFVDPDDRNVHTETIESAWAHLKRWLNQPGGVRNAHLEDAVAEYEFHRNYLRSQPRYRFWKMLRVIALYGNQARALLNLHF